MHLKFEMLMLTLYFNTTTNNVYLIYILKFVKGEMSMLMLMIMLMLMVNINVNVNVNVIGNGNGNGYYFKQFITLMLTFTLTFTLYINNLLISQWWSS